MGAIFKLIQGGDTFNLNNRDSGGRYAVANSFRPPRDGIDPVYSNSIDWGQKKTDEQENNVTWNFTVYLYGTKAAEVKRAERDLNRFLKRAGDELNPLYLAWRGWDAYSYEPAHGTFGKYERYEITHGTATIDGDYNLLSLGGASSFAPCTVTLTTKPLTTKRILAGTATGGIIEDIYKTPGGSGRGVMILPNRTNHCTNPVWDHASTWNQGWTAGAGMYETQNTNPNYFLFGGSSVRLMFDGSAASGDYYQSINVGTTNTYTFSVFAKREDGLPVTTSDFRFTNNAGTVSINVAASMGDGWYFCWGTDTGVASAVNIGIRILLIGEGVPIFFDGFTIEQASFPSFTLYGDQVGSVWTGTPHNSTSTRPSTYYMRWPSDLVMPNLGTFSIRVVWTPLVSSSSLANANYFLFDDGNFDLYYDKTNGNWNLDSVASTITSAGTFSARTPIVFHATFSVANGGALYINGTSVGSGAHKPPTVANKPDYIYLGTSDGGSSDPAYGTFNGFAIFDRAMTATEIAADYNQIATLIADDERVDEIPWLWTFNPGGVVYNQNDAAEKNYFLCGGFNGDQVDPEILATLSTIWGTISQVHFGRLAIDHRDFAQWIVGEQSGFGANILFDDESGTVDATASGGEVKTRTLTTTSAVLGNFAVYIRQSKYFANKPIRAMARVKDSGGGATANLLTSVRINYSGSTYTTETRSLPALGTTNYGLIEFEQVTVGNAQQMRPILGQQNRVFIAPVVARSTGSAAFLCDFIAMQPYPLTLTNPYSGSFSTMFILRRNFARCVLAPWSTSGNLQLTDRIITQGFPLEFEGGKLNCLTVLLGEINASDTAAITWTMTMNELWLVIRNNLG